MARYGARIMCDKASHAMLSKYIKAEEMEMDGVGFVQALHQDGASFCIPSKTMQSQT